jgi:hypothetical protein
MGFEGTEVTPQIRKLISEHHIGSILLKASNLKCKSIVFRSCLLCMSLRASTIVQWSLRCQLLGIDATIQCLIILYHLRDMSTSASSMLVQTAIIFSELVLAMDTRPPVDS